MNSCRLQWTNHERRRQRRVTSAVQYYQVLQLYGVLLQVQYQVLQVIDTQID